MIELIKGRTIINHEFVGIGVLAERFGKPDMKFVDGFLTTFDNGWSMLNDGGSCSSQDFVGVSLFDETGKILYTTTEDL